MVWCESIPSAAFSPEELESVANEGFLQIIWAAVFQFCVVKFLGALVKCITEAAGVYCEESSSFKHGRIWVRE